MCHYRRFFIIGSALCLVVGCAVKPGPDYRQAAEVITERTGVVEVYDPQADKLVQQKVAALLADGLTVDEAVAVALLNNRQFQAAFHNIGVSRADLVQSGLFTNPSMNFVGMLPAGGGRAKVEVGFAQDLVDLWQIPIRKKTAKAELDAVILDVAQQAVELAAEVRTAAYQILALRQSEATIRENLQLATQSEELARRRFEAGESSQIDVNLARSNAIDMQLELMQIERELGLAETGLSRLLSLSNNGTIWVLQDKLPEPESLPANVSLLETALAQRPDARAAEYRVLAADFEISQAWLKVFPSFSMGYGMERLEGRAMPGRKILADTARESIAAGALTAPTIQSRAERQRDKRQEIKYLHGPEFSATLPLWDQNQAQIAKARFQAEQRRKEYENVLDEIAGQVKQAEIALSKVREISQFYRQQALPQSTASLDIARRLYEAGEQGIVIVIEAQESLINRRRAYVRVLGEYAAALAEMERAIGGRLPTSTSTTSQPAGSIK